MKTFTPWAGLPQRIDQAFQDFIERVVVNFSRVGHPRFLDWTRTSPLAAAIFAERLAAALNQSGPFGMELRSLQKSSCW